MNKEEIYLDLSKLSEVEQKEIIGMLPEPQTYVQYKIYKKFNILLYSEGLKCWFVSDFKASFRQEVTYEQFKTLINE